ncbi:MAG: hypothetical protein IJA72_03795 [Clostridia bacterium]|nr:hypothetical protein [Clostridia bacterium]
MTNLKKLKLALTITFGMLIALVIGLVNMPKPSVENANNMPLNSLETPITNGGGV